MSLWFWIVTFGFALVAFVMILVILVQRPQGGGLAGAFGGAGGAGTDTVFGGRVGDALTAATVGAFIVYLSLAITLNLLETTAVPAPATPAAVTPGPTPGGIPEDAVPFTTDDEGVIRFGDTDTVPPPGDAPTQDQGGGGQ